MFLNGNSLCEGLHGKYCIIGSGVGGSSVIEALLRNGKDNFILIEAGSKEGNSDRIRGSNSGMAFDMPLTRSVQLGGTTNVWGGGFAPLDDVDFEAMDGNGVLRWPITKLELMPSYSKAANLFGIPNLDLFGRSALPESRRVQLDHLNSNKKVVQEKIFQIPLPLFRFKERLQDIFGDSKTRHCILNAPALELIHDNGIVSAVKVGTKNGLKVIEADYFFICAGALETPRLLMNSNF